jgi:LysR family hca operon transcriptional activator
MELRHLRYFITLAEEMSFTRASVRLHIAQPALSIQIKNLETEIGVMLVSREGRKIQLTAAGKVFAEQARQTLANANRGVTLTRQAANGEVGELSIGHNGLAELLVFPQIIPAFKRKWPHVHLTFQNLRTPQQVEKLRRTEIDLAFAWLPISTEEFDVKELMHVPFVAVLPEGHRLARVDSVSIKDLSEEPLILFSRRMDAESFHQIERLFLGAGAVMNVIYEYDVLLSIINFVGMGSGCSILPNYSRQILSGVVYKPLRPPNVVRSLGIIKHKGRGDLAESFYRFTVENLPSRTLERRAGSGRKRSSAN